MKLLFLFLFSLSIVNASTVKKSELEIHLSSYHTNTEEGYNNQNIGVGYNYLFNNNIQLNVGYYENSQNNDTFYMGATKWFEVTNKLNFGLGAILATGYSEYGTRKDEVVTTRESTDCTSINGLGSCPIVTTRETSTQEYTTEEEVLLTPIVGLAISYDFIEDACLKIFFSSDRSFNKKKSATDLFHFSIAIKI